MSLSKAFVVITALILMMTFVSVSFSQEDKPVVLNTLGACLKVADFRALIKNEVKNMKAGQTIKLIVDIRNEPEASEAIKQDGHALIETKQDKVKDSTTYILKVKK